MAQAFLPVFGFHKRFEEAQEPDVNATARVGSFYSGGVDSNYTLLRRKDEIDDLIVIGGFDFDMTADTFATVLNRLGPVAQAFGKTLVPIESNFIIFEKACRLHRQLSFGSALSAHALALGHRKIFIPASVNYRQLDAWGSHPLTDPLWSNGRTKLFTTAPMPAGSKRSRPSHTTGN